MNFHDEGSFFAFFTVKIIKIELRDAKRKNEAREDAKRVYKTKKKRQRNKEGERDCVRYEKKNHKTTTL